MQKATKQKRTESQVKIPKSQIVKETIQRSNNFAANINDSFGRDECLFNMLANKNNSKELEREREKRT